eukprot:TRINITY_DN11559_c0_g1_i2.p1 TRINITY_DN11559_c0_g1~~TRINITY_DN11559_c0_g1_i2.p1  ORF type:complete len:137 (-),score=14.65 TRINITY_DN11559_c0_g1_i2:273-683(-)
MFRSVIRALASRQLPFSRLRMSTETNSNQLAESEASMKEFTNTVATLRMDAILRAGMGMSRTKAEELILRGQIALNGKTIREKNHHIKVGDQLTWQRSRDHSPGFLLTQLKILESSLTRSARIQLKFARHTTLLPE